MLKVISLFILIGSIFSRLGHVQCFHSGPQRINPKSLINLVRRDIYNRFHVFSQQPTGVQLHVAAGAIDQNIRNKFIFRNRNELLKLVFVALIATASSVSVPLFFGKVLAAFTATKFDLRELLKPLSMMLLCHTVEPIMTIFYVRKCSSLIDIFVSNLRMSVYSNILRRDVSSFELNSPLSSTQLVIGEIDKIKGSAMANISRDRGARAALELMSGLGILYTLCLPLALFFSTMIPFTAYVSSTFADGLFKAAAKEGEASAKQASRAQETISNFKEVFSFSNQQLEEKRFHEVQQEASTAAIKTGYAKALFEAANRAGIYTNILSLFAVGGVLVAKKIVQPIVLVSFLGYCFSLNFATQGLIFSYGDVRTAGASWEKIQKFLREPVYDSSSAAHISEELSLSKAPVESISTVGTMTTGRSSNNFEIKKSENVDSNSRTSMNIMKGDQTMDISLKDVSFAYSNRPDVTVLHNVNLEIPRGKVTALVGPSGAGKSTIAALLNRFYEPTSGVFTVNGVLSSEISRDDYLRYVSVVRQSPALFTDTIANNIGRHCYKTNSPISISCSCHHQMNAVLPSHSCEVLLINLFTSSPFVNSHYPLLDLLFFLYVLVLFLIMLSHLIISIFFITFSIFMFILLFTHLH